MPKQEPDPDVKQLRIEKLSLLEKQSQMGEIDLFYGDTVCVSEEGYVPYGWQFKGEKVSIKSTHGRWINCFGILTRDCKFKFETTYETMDSDFIVNFFESVSFEITKPTVIVLDNASVHKSKKIKERLVYWEERGLYIAYLPPYSPHYNIIERLWRELKARWLRPEDYLTSDRLFLSVKLALGEIGKSLSLNFGSFSST